MTRQRAEIDAVEFWRQFVTAFYFENADDTLAGTLIAYRSEGRGQDAVPCIKVQTREGRVYEVTAYQERLKKLLVEQAPVIGDRIKITYTGEADRAPPGMNRAKLFTVEVRRPGSQQGRPENTPGKGVTENDPAGKTTQ
jgi:hypothetical protein